jgi:fermentation-respiration switch protein FrsA (DUF1100 family)
LGRVVRAACQVVVVGGVGLPYGMAAVMTYRPKIAIAGDPRTELGWGFEDVSFKTADGVKISAWWIPCEATGAAVGSGRTVLVCHGLGANKLNQLHVARRFRRMGYNVLTFDFRAHGASGGQFSSFGDLERRDVLAAVRWLKTNRPREARRIVGVGASLGAAALIAAASQEGSNEAGEIDAIVVYATYADFGRLTAEVADARFPWPANWLARWGGVPLASVHAGADLGGFAPVRMVGRVAPRPVMIVHGRGDELIPIGHGRALFEAAGGVKRFLEVEGDHNAIIDDEGAARAVAEFVEGALGH